MKNNILSKILVAAIIVATVFCSFLKVNVSAISVSAQAHILINADTLEILDSNNADVKLPMASTTKIMTALLLAEQNTPEKTIVTTKEMVTVEGSSMGLLEGDTVSYEALLVGMLLSSGNDAANTTAIAVGGTVENFVRMMNDRAAQIGMTNTHFVTPSGLDSEGHYSTAYDMALLTSYALKNETFRNIVKCKKYSVSYGNPPYKRTLTNHNKLLDMYEYCIGVKTGYTKKSGRCLVSAASKDGCNVIAVTLNAPSDWSDHEKLLDYGLNLLSSTDVSYELDDNTISVVGGTVDRVRIAVGRYNIGCTENSKNAITSKITLKPFIYAPVVPGEVVGLVEYIYNGKVIHKDSIYTIGDVEYKNAPEKTNFRQYLDKIVDMIFMMK